MAEGMLSPPVDGLMVRVYQRQYVPVQNVGILLNTAGSRVEGRVSER